MKLRPSALLLACSLFACQPTAPTAARSLELAPVEVPVPACQAPASALRPVGEAASSTVVLARDGDRTLAFVGDVDDQAVVAIDVDARREVGRLGLGSRPEQLLVADDGRLFVSLSDRDKLAMVHWDGAALTPICAKDLPGEPAGMAARAGRLAVASRWGSTLTLLDRELAVERVVKLPRDPYAVAFATDDRAVVSHVVGGAVSMVNVVSGEAQQLAASRTDQKVARRNFKEARSSMRFQAKKGRFRSAPVDSVQAHRRATQSYAVTVAPDGRAFIPASLADGSRAPRKTGGYGGGGSTMRTHMGVTLAVDADGSSVMVPFGRARSLPGDCQLPRGAAYDAEQGWLLVTCLGVDALRIYDVGRGTHDALRLGANVAPGPTGVAIDAEQDRAVVWSPHSGALTVTTLPTREAPKLAATGQVALTRERPVDPQIAEGRALFHAAGPDRRIAFDGRACASCHPDGRDDGITWFTAEGPRQTPILMARLEGTAPFGWNGRKDDLDGHLRRTLSRLAGHNLFPEQRAAVLAYIASMRAPRETARADEALVTRGAALYADEEVGCASCHPSGADTTDGMTHELGPSHARDRRRGFDTPSLRFVAKSAPYFHDGRYATLAELLADPTSEMGQSASLPAEDRRALEAYLLTL